MGMGSTTPEGHFGSVDGGGIPGGSFVTSINGASGVLTLTGANNITITTVGTTITVDQTLVADWTVGVCRVYAVDGTNGNDANKGYADPASSSAADYATACAAAGAVAKKTIAGLAAIFPRIGNGRKVEIVIRAGTYSDSLELALNGVAGYANGCPEVRGTDTIASAGCTAFDGSVADCTAIGMTTATGLNAAGYNPTGGPTTSTIQCVKAGGGAPGFGAEPALPLGVRIRFSATTTTAALRNICRQVCQVTGTDTVLLQTALPAVPVAGDVFFVEMAGVNIPAFTLQGNTQSASSTNGMMLAGLESSGAVTTGPGLVLTFAGCGGQNWTQSGFSRAATAQAYLHPVRGSMTVGGGFRSESTIAINASVAALAGAVAATDFSTSSTQPGFTWGAGCAARSITVNATQQGDGDSTQVLPTFGVAAATSVGVPHTFGAGGGLTVGFYIDGSVLTIGNMNCIGAGAHPALKLAGKCTIVFKGVLGGSTGNTDVGMDLQSASNCEIGILATTAPTVTGSAGDIRKCGQALSVWTNYQFQEAYDIARNHIYQLTTNGEYRHTVTPSCTLGVNNSGIAISAAYTLVRYNTANLQFTPIQADTAAHCSGLYGITDDVVQNGAAGIVGAPEGFRIVNFDGAPTLDAIAYVSPGSPGMATTTVPAVSGTNQKLRLGTVVGNSFPGTIGLVRWNPEVLPVLADGLA